MAYLHEVIAVEGDLKLKKDAIQAETKNTFSKKPDHFLGGVKRLEMFDEKRKVEEGEESKEMVTTVRDKLDYAAEAFIAYWDVKLKKEATNQEARANIVIDGAILAEDVPVTFLLNMEGELKALREMYLAIPTLQPGIKWEMDETMGRGVYRMAKPMVKNKTEKSLRFQVVQPVTKEHPAQVKDWNVDEPIGKIIVENWSSMMTPAEKSMRLSRIDKLMLAVKQARQRANTQEVTERTIGKAFFDFIHAK